MQRIIRQSTGDEYRICFISDIHGNLKLLKELLSKIDLSDGDFLVFGGDYINRGGQSADTLRFIRELSVRKNTFVLKGNLERLADWYMLWGEPEHIIPHFSDHKNNLFCELARECGYENVNFGNFYEIRTLLSEKYADYLKYLRELPLALETEDFIFVHAGISESGTLHDSTEQEILKNDGYLAHGKNNTGKWVVVGHIPVWNVPESKNTNNPVIFEGRKIIGTDGGNCVKNFSQLNALIIGKGKHGISFKNVFADDSPVIKASSDFALEHDNGYFKDSWPDYYLNILETGEDFSLCERTVSKQTGFVKNEHIGFENGRYLFLKSTCSHIQSVRAGERLYLLDENGGRYAFIKNMSGEVGWVKKSALKL
jgi:protein phosphatase